jgi:hypothetical protein
MTLTRLKIDCIRYDSAAEFAKIATFKAFCVNNCITIEETAAYTHTFNARAKGAVRIVKEHMRCLLRRANLPRHFWPYAMLHFCSIYAYWPDTQGKSAWEKLDAHGPHALCHDEARDLHRFGSYVTGHLPRMHPLVENETLDDRALEGVWLGNDLSTVVIAGAFSFFPPCNHIINIKKIFFFFRQSKRQRNFSPSFFTS